MPSHVKSSYRITFSQAEIKNTVGKKLTSEQGAMVNRFMAEYEHDIHNYVLHKISLANDKRIEQEKADALEARRIDARNAFVAMKLDEWAQEEMEKKVSQLLSKTD